MNTNTPIYLSYTDADNVAPFFQFLDGKEGFDLVVSGAGIFKRTLTKIHTRSPKPEEPPIEIACITDRPISREEADQISQSAINFLMDSGKIKKTGSDANSSDSSGSGSFGDIRDFPEGPYGMDDDQAIVGCTRHDRTGHYIVWMSLEGNDVTPIGAWRSADTANEITTETLEAYRHLVEAIDAAEPDQVEEVGVDTWTAFLEDMKKRSDAEPQPFSDKQLAVISANIAAMFEQRKQMPEKPEGFSRVTLYSESALEGRTMPRVRLTPMQFPQKKKGKR